MPDEPDESETGDPADGSEEPPESPDDGDPERESPIDPTELDTRDDAGETTASDGAERETEDAPEAESDADTDDADADDSPAEDGRDDPDPGRNADDEDDASEETGGDETPGDATDTDLTDEDSDGDDPTAGDDPDEPGVATGDAADSDAADAVAADDNEADADEGEGDEAADADDGKARGEEAEDDEDGADSEEADADDSGIDGLDDWPSVGPEPVDVDSEEDDVADDTDDADEEEPAGEGGDGEDGAAGEAEPDDDDETEDVEDDADDGAEDAALPQAQTDGEGYVRDHPGGGGSTTDDGLGGISTPPDDQEMPLADHIEEMILRLAAVLLVGAVATVIGLLGASWAVDYIWQNVLPANLDAPPHVYHPLELWLTRIKVAALLGILVALPMFVYQCYLFMRPGLYPNERKYYLSAVPMSLVLAVVGMFISFVLVLPILFRYFTFYSEGSAGIAYALGETFNLIITLTGFLAIVFQIPLFIMLAIMMGVTTRQWLVDKRLYFWAAFFGLSFMFTMDPTLMAPIIVGIIMIVLFEGTLLLLRWTGQE